MSAALMAQPGLNSTATAVSMKVLRFLFTSLLRPPLIAPHWTSKDSSTYRRPCLILAPDPLSVLLSPHPHNLVPYTNTFPPYSLPLTPLNTEPLRSKDLPWISPGSPLRLTDTRLRVFPCFPSLAPLVSPSSPHPCFSVTLSYFYL